MLFAQRMGELLHSLELGLLPLLLPTALQLINL